MTDNRSEYALSGVDYTKIQGFKDLMIEVGEKTLAFPYKKWKMVVERGDHGCRFYSANTNDPAFVWSQTTEGLGNKNWIAEWMYQFSGTGRTYYDGIGWDAALMAVNDLIACGAMPVVYTDEVAAGDSEWFTDLNRSRELAGSYYQICEEIGMALPAGESPSLRYLVKSEPPVTSCPTLSGCATGFIPDGWEIRDRLVKVGDRIIGVNSSGLHCNGISLVIRRALALPEQFLTKLPNGNTLGEEALLPTRSYVGLVEALLSHHVSVHAFIPGTGDGVSKVAFDKRPFTYRIGEWPEVPVFFKFMENLGVSLQDCLKTFNWGVGYFVIVPEHEVDRTIELGEDVGYELMEIGRVEEGERKVIFEPGKLELAPPGH